MSAGMRRSRIFLSLLILAAVFAPIGMRWYFLAVRVEDLNRQRWCNCGDRQVEFKEGSISLLYSPHPETENIGTVIGTYRVEDGTLNISGIQTAGEYVLDHLGAHWKAVPGGENWMGGEFYDHRSWKLTLYRLADWGWQRVKSFFRHELRRDPVWWVLIAGGSGVIWWQFRKTRARRALKQESTEAK